jgi:hypothetical protein
MRNGIFPCASLTIGVPAENGSFTTSLWFDVGKVSYKVFLCLAMSLIDMVNVKIVCFDTNFNDILTLVDCRDCPIKNSHRHISSTILEAFTLHGVLLIQGMNMTYFHSKLETSMISAREFDFRKFPFFLPS